MSDSRSKYKIVIADDSPLYRKLLAETLANGPYEVFVAKNGREALDFVAQHRPAVLITDWEMPDLTGLEICSQLRRDPEFLTYVILLTSNDQKEQIVKGL